MQTILTLISVAVLGASASDASVVPSIPVPDTLTRRLLDEHPTLERLGYLTEADREGISPAGVLPDPVVGIRFNGIPANRSGATVLDQVRIQASQTFPLSSELSIREAIARDAADLSGLRETNVARSLIGSMKRIYFQLYALDRAIVVTGESADLVDQFVRIAEVKYAIGRGAQPELLRAQVELSTLLNHVDVFREQRRGLTARFNELLDRPSFSEIDVPSYLDAPNWEPDLALLDAYADSVHPSLRLARLAQSQAVRRVDLAGTAYRPHMTVGAEYWASNEADDQFAAMFGVNIPIYRERKLAPGVRQARENLSAAGSRIFGEWNFITANIAQGVADYRAAMRRVELYRAEVIPQAEQALEAAQIAYENDRLDFLNLLDSERTLLNVQLAYDRAVADAWASVVSIEASVGGPKVLRGEVNNEQ